MVVGGTGRAVLVGLVLQLGLELQRAVVCLAVSLDGRSKQEAAGRSQQGRQRPRRVRMGG